MNTQSITSSNRLAVNAVYSLAGQVLPMLIGVISIPILIQHLGTDRFGVLTLAWIVISYFSLFDLGLGRALTQLVAERLGKGEDNRSISELTWTASFLMLALGIVGAIIFALVSPLLVLNILNIPAKIQHETLLTFYILTFSIPVVTSTAGLTGFLSALQRFDLINAVKVPLGLYMFVGPLLVLPFSNQLTFIVATLLVGRIVSWFVYVKLCIKAMPALRVHKVFRQDLFVPLMKFGGWMTLTNVVGPLMVYMDRFLISGLISVTAVAYYATPYEVVTKLWIIPSALVSVLFPAFSTSFASDPRRAERLFYLGLKYIFISLFPIVLTIVTFSYEGLSFWLGKEFAENSTPVLQCLAIGVLINSLAQVPFSLIQGLGRPDITSKFHLIELPFYLAILWWLTTSFGIVGAAAAWVIRVSLDTILLFNVARSMLSLHAKQSLRIKDFQLLFVLSFVPLLLSLLHLNLLEKGLLFTLLIISFGILSWFYLLDKNEHQMIVSRLSSLRLKFNNLGKN